MPHDENRRSSPVSGPGKLSQRTDQPLRAPTGMDFGERKAILAQQRARRLPEGQGVPEPGSAGGGQPQAEPLTPGSEDAFRPTDRPDESPTADLGGPVSMLPEDPDEFARALYSVSHNEDLRRLLEWRENRMMQANLPQRRPSRPSVAPSPPSTESPDEPVPGGELPTEPPSTGQPPEQEA